MASGHRHRTSGGNATEHGPPTKVLKQLQGANPGDLGEERTLAWAKNDGTGRLLRQPAPNFTDQDDESGATVGARELRIRPLYLAVGILHGGTVSCGTMVWVRATRPQKMPFVATRCALESETPPSQDPRERLP